MIMGCINLPIKEEVAHGYGAAGTFFPRASGGHGAQSTPFQEVSHVLKDESIFRTWYFLCVLPLGCSKETVSPCENRSKQEI